MTHDQVLDLSRRGSYYGEMLSGQLVETHISWVLFSDKYAFKIKKPLKFSFLDFSTSRLREINCQKEILLNSRFSNIYLSTEPVFFKNGNWEIGGQGDKPIDYVVVMRKMDDAKRMDRMIESGEVDGNSIVDLAKMIARLHLLAPEIDNKFDLFQSKALFNDIASLPDLLDGTYKKEDIRSVIKSAIEKSNTFLEKNQYVFQERIDHGLKRDLHGDLHCSAWI